MKRRSFLQFLGLAPAAPLAAKLPAPAIAAPVAAAVAPIVEVVTSTPGPEIAASGFFTIAVSYYEHPGFDRHTLTEIK